MKAKNIISFLLVIMIALTPNTGCFAMFTPIPNTDISGDSDDERIPLIREKNQEERAKQKRVINKTREINGRVVVLKNIHEITQEELDDLNRGLIDSEGKCRKLEEQVKVAKRELQAWTDDVLCETCLCCRNPIDAVRSIIRDDINHIPSSSTCRSKRFYKGMAVGSVIVAVILVGVYVYVYYIHVPARSE